jgi:hypothetical protein
LNPLAFLTESRADRRQRREQAQQATTLRGLVRRRDAAVAELAESLDVTGTNVISPLDRYFDGDRLLLPAGTLQDRRYGNDLPVLPNEQTLGMMRAYSRLVCEANGYAIGFLDHLTNYVVGPGFAWQVKPKGGGPADPDGGGPAEPDPRVRAAQDCLDEWRVAAEWGHGEDDREAETFKRLVRDGEAFLRLGRGDRGKLPWVRSVEPEQVGCPQSASPASSWSWGVLTDADDVETRLAYHVKDPGGAGGEEVPADRVLHIKGNTDRTIKRGVPDFWPVADGVEGSRKLVRNMTTVAGLQAAIAWVRQHAPTTTPDMVNRYIQQTADGESRKLGAAGSLGAGGGRGDGRRPVQGVEPGTRPTPSAGPRPPPPTPGFVQVLQAGLRAAGARWNMPEYFSGDASNANFASTMVAGSPFVKAAQARQKRFKAFQEKLARRVLELCVESGRLSRDVLDAVAVECTPPPVAIGNPLQDHQIREGQNRAGVLSVRTWQEMEGLDPEVEAANRREYEDQFPPGGGGGPQLPPMGDDGGDDDPFGGGGSGGFGEAVTPGRRHYSRREYARLSEEGRAGLIRKTITNRLGRKQTVFVAPDADAPASRTPAADGPSAAHQAGAKLKVAFGTVGRLKDHALDTKAARVLHAAEHHLMTAAHKTRDVVDRAAALRGMSDAGRKSLSRCLALADFAGGYATGAAGAAVGGVLGAKVGMVMPSASAVYLLYSTARDPRATYRAACEVVAASSLDPRHVARRFKDAWLGKAHEADGNPAWVGGLADLLHGAADDHARDWHEAVFLAALGSSGDPDAAVGFARDNPDPPADGPTTESVDRPDAGPGDGSADADPYADPDGRTDPVFGDGDQPTFDPDGDFDGDPADDGPTTEATKIGRDKLGRRYKTVDGKRVPLGDGDKAPDDGVPDDGEKPESVWMPAGKAKDGRDRWQHAHSETVKLGDKPAEPSPEYARRREEYRAARLATPPIAHGTEDEHAAHVDLFGRTGGSMTAVLGLPNGSEARVYKVPNKFGAAGVSIDHPDVTSWSRTVAASPDGTLTVSNNMFFARPRVRGTGFGLGVLSRQVQESVAEGVTKITTTAGRGRLNGVSMNGYYTWPRLGYDADLPHGMAEKLPAGLKGAKTVLDLMVTPEGRDYWKKNGECMAMTFDTTPGSRSLAVMDAYLKSKGKPGIDQGDAVLARRESSVAGRKARFEAADSAEKAKAVEAARRAADPDLRDADARAAAAEKYKATGLLDEIESRVQQTLGMYSHYRGRVQVLYDQHASNVARERFDGMMADPANADRRAALGAAAARHYRVETGPDLDRLASTFVNSDPDPIGAISRAYFAAAKALKENGPVTAAQAAATRGGVAPPPS